MARWNSEQEAREQIKSLVSEYYHDFKENKGVFMEGDRISYASRVFDEKEMWIYKSKEYTVGHKYIKYPDSGYSNYRGEYLIPFEYEE